MISIQQHAAHLINLTLTCSSLK